MMTKTIFPTPKRPGEYIAFAVLPMNTIKDGQVFMYMAVDAFSKFAYHLGVDRNDNPETILKYIYLLTEDPQFRLYRDKGFTLVFDKHEEMTDRINHIISGVKGNILMDKSYNNFIITPVLKSFFDFLARTKD